MPAPTSPDSLTRPVRPVPLPPSLADRDPTTIGKIVLTGLNQPLIAGTTISVVHLSWAADRNEMVLNHLRASGITDLDIVAAQSFLAGSGWAGDTHENIRIARRDRKRLKKAKKIAALLKLAADTGD